MLPQKLTGQSDSRMSKPLSHHPAPKRGKKQSEARGRKRTFEGKTKLHSFLALRRGGDSKFSMIKSLRTLDERKTLAPLDDTSLPVYSSLIDPLQVYPFRLGGYTTLNLTAGVINAFIAADPSAAGWNSPEWATLSALFSEFRLRSLTVQVQRSFIPLTGTTSVGNLMMASNLGTATAPGSYAALADNADAVQMCWANTSNCGLFHTMRATDLNWSQVTTPTTEPYAGAPGSIQFYSDNGGTAVSGLTYQIIISGIYEFRIRV